MSDEYSESKLSPTFLIAAIPAALVFAVVAVGIAFHGSGQPAPASANQRQPAGQSPTAKRHPGESSIPASGVTAKLMGQRIAIGMDKAVVRSKLGEPDSKSVAMPPASPNPTRVRPEDLRQQFQEDAMRTPSETWIYRTPAGSLRITFDGDSVAEIHY